MIVHRFQHVLELAHTGRSYSHRISTSLEQSASCGGYNVLFGLFDKGFLLAELLCKGRPIGTLLEVRPQETGINPAKVSFGEVRLQDV